MLHAATLVAAEFDAKIVTNEDGSLSVIKPGEEHTITVPSREALEPQMRRTRCFTERWHETSTEDRREPRRDCDGVAVGLWRVGLQLGRADDVRATA